jgi:hypothetical protein
MTNITPPPVVTIDLRDAIKSLLKMADEAEAKGVACYKSSCRPGNSFAYSEFGSALRWGREAQGFRVAVLRLKAMQREQNPVRKAARAARGKLRAFALRWL